MTNETHFTQEDSLEEVVVVKSIYQTLSKERKEILLKTLKEWCEDEINKLTE